MALAIGVIIGGALRTVAKVFVKEPPPAEVKTCPFCKEPNAVHASKCRARASAN